MRGNNNIFHDKNRNSPCFCVLSPAYSATRTSAARPHTTRLVHRLLGGHIRKSVNASETLILSPDSAVPDLVAAKAEPEDGLDGQVTLWALYGLDVLAGL